ncbi:MAG: FAD-binding protein, partial [Desulfobacterales bacterium]|nr:FAD-binding protein [Desulfobacterales bacterium]MDD4393839.1 FAD-binding protein [Desulfobacterales bacterium]
MEKNQNLKNMSRRKFMAIAGGAAGLAVMASMGLSAERGECSANIPAIDIDKIAVAENEADVLVVGGGIAGLFAAVKAHDAGASVLMVSKGRLGSS